MSESNPKKIQPTHIIIAILVVITLLQAAALLAHRKQSTPIPNYLPKSTPTAQMQVPTPSKTPNQPPVQRPALGSMMQDPWATDPFEEFDAMSRRLSNIMRQTFMASAPLMHSMGVATPTGVNFNPAVDLEETEKAYIVRGDLPGLDKDKINITVRNNVLTLEGTRETSSETHDTQKGFYSKERSYGSFARSLALPGPVDESKITASYENGVLTVTLPKIAQPQDTRKVAIQ